MEVIAEKKKYDFDRVFRIILTVALVVAVIYVVNYLSGILLPFLVGCLLAYVLEPIVKFIQRILHLSNRMIPAVITMLLFLGSVFLVFCFLVPYLIDEFAEMGKLLTSYATHEFSKTGIPTEVQRFINGYLNPDTIKHLFSQEQWMKIAKGVMSGTWTVVDGTLSVVMGILSFLMALLYMFFVMIDYDKISHAFKSAVPRSYRRMTFRIFQDVTNTMSRYFRGQALVSFFVGIIFAIGFLIMGLPMAIVFGLSIGVMNMVPYLQLISIPFAAFLCLVQSVNTGGAFLPLFGWVIVVYCVCQLIQDMVLVPAIMKQQMGLRPAIIFLALSVWGYVLGFIGLIVALPLTTLLISYYSEFVLHTPNPLYKNTAKAGMKKKGSGQAAKG